MKSFQFICLSFFSLFYFSACAISDSVRARELLTKCEYKITNLELKTLDFAPRIALNNGKKLSVKKPALKKLLPVVNQIRKGNFDLELQNLDFIATLEIKNPTDHQVELDSLFLNGFLDEKKMAKVQRNEHTVVPAKEKRSTQFTVSLPTKFPFNKIWKAKEISLEGKLWLDLMLTKETRISVPIPVSLSKEIPREEIKKLMQAKKSEYAHQLLKNLDRTKKTKSFQNAIKKFF